MNEPLQILQDPFLQSTSAPPALNAKALLFHACNSFSIILKRTVVLVALALPVFFMVSMTGCKKESTTEPHPIPDTTSHNYSWQEWTMGDEPGSSDLNDAAIFDDTLVYAAGAIYLKDSSGIVAQQPFNLLRWTGGSSWAPYRVWFQGALSDTIHHLAFDIRSLWCVSPTELWAAMEGQEVAKWIDTQQAALAWTPVTIEKFWASSGKDILAVGRRGEFTHYNGTAWSQPSSPTNVDLLDVWGRGNRRWACGYMPNYFPSVLLRSDDAGGSWRLLWQSDTTVMHPFGLLIISIWASDHYLYIAADDGVYFLGIDDPLDAAHLKVALKLSSPPHRIRGTSDNNIGLALDDGSLWHFNGASWKQITPSSPFEPLYSVDVSDHLIVGTGFDGNSIFSKGRVVIARRM